MHAPSGLWDRAGIAQDGDAVYLKRHFVTEINHGRTSVLAAIDRATSEISSVPPDRSLPIGQQSLCVLFAFGAISKEPSVGWAQIISQISLCLPISHAGC